MAVDNRAEQEENRELAQPRLCTRFRSRDRERVSSCSPPSCALSSPSCQVVMRGQKRVEDARERAYHPRIDRKKFFRSGWIGPRVKPGEVKPGNDEITATEFAARRRTVCGNSISRCQTAQIFPFPRRMSAPEFCIVASPTRIEGCAERRETFGCSGTRWTCHDAACQAPSCELSGGCPFGPNRER